MVHSHVYGFNRIRCRCFFKKELEQIPEDINTLLAIKEVLQQQVTELRMEKESLEAERFQLEIQKQHSVQDVKLVVFFCIFDILG